MSTQIRRTYYSARSVRGYPYLALAGLVLRQAAKTKRGEGYYYWHPTGPVEYPEMVRGVPATWYRQGTRQMSATQEERHSDPRPWETLDAWTARTGCTVELQPSGEGK